jgi:hypothetical protein
MIKKQSLVVLLLLCTSYMGFGQVAEGFETGLPPAGGGYTIATSYNLSSGTWTGTSMQVIENNNLANVHSGTKSLQLRSQTDAQIVTPNITTGVGTVTFWASSSKSTGSVQVNYSIDGGVTWLVATGSPFGLVSGSLVQKVATINRSNPNILVRFRRTASTVYIDDVSITTFSVTPTPEINIEGNLGTYPDITNGDSTPSGTDNTLFAAQFIGASQSKSFRINNEGTTDLTITGITIGGTNPSDFTITASPSNMIGPSAFSLLEITFSPLASGVRTAIVSITNNDSDENPFTFTIQGTGNCVSSSLSISPLSGPVDTRVTVTGTNFGALTTAALSGINASYTLLSTTSIEVVVPNNATTGNLVVINDLGCTSSISFSVIDKIIGGCEGGGTLSDLIISEVTDATTGGVTYIELYNGTGSNKQLNNYSLEVYSNGSSTASGSVSLGPINFPNNSTYVVAIGVTGSPDTSNTCSITGGNGELADEISGIGGINKKDNEHDAIRLLTSNGTVVVDQFGIFLDSNWMDATTITGDRGFNFRRLNTASPLPNPSGFALNDWNIIDWAGSAQKSCDTNDYSDIGFFDFSTASPPSITTQPIASSSTCDLTATLTVEADEGFVGGNGLDYQWYYLKPGDSSWTTVPISAPYIGETTNVLDITNTQGLNGYQFYCQIRENDDSCYKTTNVIKLDVYSTSWDGTIWSNGAPTLGTIATLNGNYNTSTNGNLTACSLTVNNTFTLNITDGYYVEVENDVTVNGSITVETQGSLVQNNDSGTFTLGLNGNSQVNKFTSPLPEWRAYTYWSSPVTNVTAGSALPFSIRRYYFDANNYIDADEDGLDDNANDWVPLIDDDVMTPGIGYIASHTNIGFIPNTPYQYFFKGAFNTGPITPLLGFNASNLANWNLVGNPYPCALDIDRFFIENVDDNTIIEGIVYLWSHYSPASAENTYGNEILNYSFSDYAIINRSGQIAGADKKFPERHIASGQGFFVNSLSPDNLTFNNSMRKDNKGNIIDNTQFFRSSNTGKINAAQRIWLNLTADHGVFNQILIAYLDKASDGYDGLSYDAEPVYTGWANIYTSIEGESRQFGIQGKASESLTIDETIPLGFNAWIDVPTIYTISIPKTEGDFLTSNPIYMKDNFLNKVHNLTNSDYTFTSEVGEFKDRFEIVFKFETLSDIETQLNLNKLTIIELNDGRVQLKTNTNLTIKSVQILDMLGRTLYLLKGTSSTEIYNLNTLSQSAYIARVELSNGQIITKKTIKRN